LALWRSREGGREGGREGEVCFSFFSLSKEGRREGGREGGKAVMIFSSVHIEVQASQ
jgi:hypothetical protein